MPLFSCLDHQDLLPVLGITKSGDGFELSEVMEWVGKAYNSPNADVRAETVRVTKEVHDLVGPAIRCVRALACLSHLVVHVLSTPLACLSSFLTCCVYSMPFLSTKAGCSCMICSMHATSWHHCACHRMFRWPCVPSLYVSSCRRVMPKDINLKIKEQIDAVLGGEGPVAPVPSAPLPPPKAAARYVYWYVYVYVYGMCMCTGICTPTCMYALCLDYGYGRIMRNEMSALASHATRLHAHTGWCAIGMTITKASMYIQAAMCIFDSAASSSTCSSLAVPIAFA